MFHLDAANFIRVIGGTAGFGKIGCPEEIAYRQEYITQDQLRKLAKVLRVVDMGHI